MAPSACERRAQAEGSKWQSGSWWFNGQAQVAPRTTCRSGRGQGSAQCTRKGGTGAVGCWWCRAGPSACHTRSARRARDASHSPATAGLRADAVCSCTEQQRAPPSSPQRRWLCRYDLRELPPSLKTHAAGPMDAGPQAQQPPVQAGPGITGGGGVDDGKGPDTADAIDQQQQQLQQEAQGWGMGLSRPAEGSRRGSSSASSSSAGAEQRSDDVSEGAEQVRTDWAMWARRSYDAVAAAAACRPVPQSPHSPPRHTHTPYVPVGGCSAAARQRPLHNALCACPCPLLMQRPDPYDIEGPAASGWPAPPVLQEAARLVEAAVEARRQQMAPTAASAIRPRWVMVGGDGTRAG